jgi:hypothetical protein
MSLKDINERLERIEKQNKYILGNQISILELIDKSNQLQGRKLSTKFSSKDFMLAFTITLVFLVCYTLIN